MTFGLMQKSFLADQQVRLQAHVMQHMAEGVILVSPETGRIIYTNPRFDSLLGYAPGQLPGHPAEVLHTGSDAERQALVRTADAWRVARGVEKSLCRWPGNLARREGV